MRTTVRTLLVLGLAAAPVHASAQALGGDLADLARIREDVATRRVSSHDRSGGNNDRIENIGVGETREIFNVEGAGVINHIWITIAPPPPELSRNDIVVRMYWDGSVFPPE